MIVRFEAVTFGSAPSLVEQLAMVHDPWCATGALTGRNFPGLAWKACGPVPHSPLLVTVPDASVPLILPSTTVLTIVSAVGGW